MLRISFIFFFFPRFFKKDDGSWAAEKVIDIPNVKVDGWSLPEVPGIIDILILANFNYKFGWKRKCDNKYFVFLFKDSFIDDHQTETFY